MSLRVIILAGQRPGTDPLCHHAGVPFKADVEIGGIAMVERVAEALRGAGLVGPFDLSGYPNAREGFRVTKSGEGPADSALVAASSGGFPVLVTTCDHALLTPDIVMEFLEGAQASGADFVVGLATKERIKADYPQTKRTYMVFNDVAVSGCNLFYIRNEAGLAAIHFWRDAQHLRKKPLRLASKIGAAITLKYALKRLSLQDAFDYASRRVGAKLAPVLINHAEAAIDVDSPADLALVEEILSRRDLAR